MTKEIEIDRQLITRRWTPSPPAVDPPSKPASAPWSTAWPPRTLPGATDASTASSPASASLHHLEHPPPGRRGGRAALRGAQDTDLRPVQPGRSAPYPGGVNGGTDLGQFSTGAGPGDPGLRRVPPRHHRPAPAVYLLCHRARIPPRACRGSCEGVNARRTARPAGGDARRGTHTAAPPAHDAVPSGVRHDPARELVTERATRCPLRWSTLGFGSASAATNS